MTHKSNCQAQLHSVLNSSLKNTYDAEDMHHKINFNSYNL